MNNILNVYAVRWQDGKIIAVKTQNPDIITLEKMKSLIAINGIDFVVNINGKEYRFEFDGEYINSPDEKILKQIQIF